MKTPSKGLLQGAIALMIAAGFLTYLFVITFTAIPVNSKDLALAMVEVLKSGFLILIGFLYGASKNEQERAAPPPPPPAEPAQPTEGPK